MTAVRSGHQTRGEGLIEIDGVGYYAISDVDLMSPFLMSVVSDGDRWMYVSSTGGITAGRMDSSRALFPYETDDRLHHAAGVTGPVTAVRTPAGALWTPFRGRTAGGVRRHLYKSVVGDAIVFEEEHPELRLTISHRWASCDRFGFVRTSTLINHADVAVRLSLLDGLLGVLPYGLEPAIYQSLSNLTHAYKRSEVVDGSDRLATFSLESRIVDRPEPDEVLRASVVWSLGFDAAELSLSPDALEDFERGREHPSVGLLTGRPGAYLLSGDLDLNPGEECQWRIVADVAAGQATVTRLRSMLQAGVDIQAEIASCLEGATDALVGIMAPADALQRTGDRVATAHQFANVTYNVMRGGIPVTGYRLEVADVVRFLEDRNRPVAALHRTWLESLEPEIEWSALLDRVVETNDPQLIRLGFEYLPFGFSRRHGDPSRPWNRFSIRVRDEAGRPIVYYEGNWRDIFQNWEALCTSFPDYLPATISVFVNASTPDGFNPYRITRHGIDWEVPDPDDPWSHIGYWGDHQIVYLLRLLEAADRYLPGQVVAMLGRRLFSYADVPYRIVSYERLVANPKLTIDYDDGAADRAAQRVDAIGGDGKLLTDTSGDVYLATLAEKLLVPALSKLSNFVPGGGIWMNTQRPEWNDANNALVGYGISMVTLYHLRRYLGHLAMLVRASDLPTVELSAEVAHWLEDLTRILDNSVGSGAESDGRLRRRLMDDLGMAFTRYRSRVYETGFTGTVTVPTERFTHLCDVATVHLDDTIALGRRGDGLYHSYNLIRFETDEASVEHLQEMLEGQVAILDSGVLTAEQRLEVIEALFASAMYRADQKSFMLYPAIRPRAFLDKNVIPASRVTGNELFLALVDRGEESVILVDADGRFRFNPDISSRDDLSAALDHLAESSHWSSLVALGSADASEIYEEVFEHHSYTGRSGSMYGYEGIGSVYWHMVAKLLVAAQTSLLDAQAVAADPETVTRLADAYWRIRGGLGFNKTAHEFGAIPIDPYSHSPAHSGAQQPGMTGLVKEELLTRPLEVGIRVEAGQIVFDPILLRNRELLSQPETWRVHDLTSRPLDIDLPAGSLGATVCQVPVLVAKSDVAELVVSFADASERRIPGTRLDRETSRAVFTRTGEVERIRVFLPVADSSDDVLPA